MKSHQSPTILTIACLALLAVGCATGSGDGEPSGAEPYGVVAAPPLPRADPGVGFDPSTEIADHDGSVVVRVNQGRLEFHDEATEAPTTVDVAADAELRAVAADGQRAALLQRPDRLTSLITVVDRSGAEPTVEAFELTGLIEPEAFSTDGSLLFVIDHRVSDVPGAYRVRPLDLATGRLETILTPLKVPLTDLMNGVGRRQTWSPNGSRLYTLYVRQTHHHHDDDVAHGHGEPGTDGFVHVLDLDDEWAYCLDLPPAFGAGDLATTALAVAPAGDEVAVVDLTANQIAFASTRELAVTHTLDLPSFVTTGRGAAISHEAELHLALTSSGVAIGRGSEIHWLDRRSLKASSPQPDRVDGELSGLTGTSDRVLAWTEDAEAGPVELLAP